MGQENSVISDDTPPNTLSERNLDAVAEYIKSGQCKRILVMTGAGISTAAGIPDFRSPNTGLYANLARLNLPYAEAVFDISYFREHPEPFYVLAQELYPGKFYPTVSHAFIALLAAKGLLFHLFTQNIDCLERRAGVPDDLIVEAHGSFATQRCIDCKAPYPDDEMLQHVESGSVPRCKNCGVGLVKPDIVFFGEQLPDAFRSKQHYPAMADLVLILGTSLTVHPFASLPEMVREDVPRVLFNLERVGGIGSRADDVIELGDCDAGIRKLAEALGWKEELEREWRRVVGDDEAERQLKGAEKRAAATLDEEVDKLAAEVGRVELEEQDSEADDKADSSRDSPAQTPAAGEGPSASPATGGSEAKAEEDNAGRPVGAVEKQVSAEDDATRTRPEPEAKDVDGKVAGEHRPATTNMPKDFPSTAKLAETSPSARNEGQKRPVTELPGGKSEL